MKSKDLNWKWNGCWAIWTFPKPLGKDFECSRSQHSALARIIFIFCIFPFFCSTTRALHALNSSFAIHHPERARDPFISTNCAMVSSGWNGTFYKILGPFAAFFPFSHCCGWEHNSREWKTGKNLSKFYSLSWWHCWSSTRGDSINLIKHERDEELSRNSYFSATTLVRLSACQLSVCFLCFSLWRVFLLHLINAVVVILVVAVVTANRLLNAIMTEQFCALPLDIIHRLISEMRELHTVISSIYPRYSQRGTAKRPINSAYIDSQI